MGLVITPDAISNIIANAGGIRGEYSIWLYTKCMYDYECMHRLHVGFITDDHRRVKAHRNIFPTFQEKQ
jgi:hypothetical protein